MTDMAGIKNNAVICVLLFSMLATAHMFGRMFLHEHNSIALPRQQRKVLVMYTFSDTDPAYLPNLAFFVEESARQRDDSDYIFIINTNANVPNLPPLAGIRGKYLLHRNECFDWGTFGWAIKEIDIKRYTHFVFVNSSVRGPFVPSYVNKTWTELLVSQITHDVKLVGPTISCEHVSLDKTRRTNPHVQSYTIATDYVGMTVLLASPVFACHSNIKETIFHSELGASKAILDAGYNIASLMSRYSGIDWRNTSNWGCNSGMNPYGQHANDGTTLEAFEVMFVKVKGHLLSRKLPYMVLADKVSKWKTRYGPELNDFAKHQKRYKLPQVLASLARGIRCFDCAYYMETNMDLPRIWTCGEAFNHFVNSGDAEGRPARYTCDFDADMVDTSYVPAFRDKAKAAMVPA